MNTQIPKNVRQIGEIHPEHKIYMEDYVVTYFRQLCKKETGTFWVTLYGKNIKRGESIYHYIYAAAPECGGAANEERFAGTDVVGKAVIGGFEAAGDYKEENRLLYFIDTEREEEKFFFLQNQTMSPILGYYIYYDKNDMMQNFLIDWYKENTVPAEQTVRDRAAKTFRNVNTGRKEEAQQRKIISLLYMASLMLVMLCCIAGITMINQYDKMKSMERAIEHLAQALEEQRLPERQVLSNSYMIETEQETEEEAGIEEESVSAETAEEENFYTVLEGDTLAKICREHYGTSSKIADVCRQNQIEDPNNITVGQKIVLP